MAPPSRSSSRQRTPGNGPPKGDGWTRTIMISDGCPEDMKPRSSSWKPSDFDITKTLFVGKRSVIYRATVLGSGQELVLKVYVKNRLAAVHRKQVEREIQIHGALAHPNIINLYAAFEDEHHVYLMIESASKGDLLDDMNKRETFYPPETIVRFVIQILDALRYLHKKGIMHRDMKPENIVIVDNKYSIKIIDFGLSIDYSQERPVSAVGTLQYMAPEVVVCPTKSRPEENKDNPLLQYGTGADIWAVGVLTYELLTGRAPFDTGKKTSEEDTEKRIMYSEPSYPKSMDPVAAEFVRKTISKTAVKRPSASELLCHRWITEVDASGLPATATDTAPAPAPTPAPAAAVKHQSQQQQTANIEISSALGASTSPASKAQDERTGNSNALASHQSMVNIHQGNRPALAQERSVPSGIAKHIHADKDSGNAAQLGKVHEGQAATSPLRREESDLDSAFRRSTSNKSSPNSPPADGPVHFTGSVQRMKGAPESPTSPARIQQHLQVPLRPVPSRRQSLHQTVAVDSTLMYSPRKGAPINGRTSVASRGNAAAAASLSSRSRTPHGAPQQQPLAAQRSFNVSLLSNRTAGYSPAGGVSDKILQQRLGSNSPKTADHPHTGTLRLYAESSAPALLSEPRPVRIGQIHGTIPSVKSQVVVVAGGGSPSSIVRPSTTHVGQRAGVFNVPSSPAARPSSRGPTAGSSYGRSSVQKSPAFARWTPGAAHSSSRAWANGGTPDSLSAVHQGANVMEKWAANRTMPASSRENMTRGIRNSHNMAARPSLSVTSPLPNSAFVSHRVTASQHQQAAV